jgi:hypothetical protein
MLAASIVLAVATGAFSLPDKVEKPKLTVKVTPAMGGTAPTRIVASADLVGGPDGTAELYCPAIEWEWGDDTRSTNKIDCDPYEAGKSEIKRRFVADHVYQSSGEYRVQFRMKKKDKTILAGSTSVKVRPGLGDPGDR